MNLKLVTVVIPIYKEDMSEFECLSFRQCLHVLRDYEITIMTYQELSLANYLKICSDYSKLINVEYFNCSYFQSVADYNKLMLSKMFYERFSAYEYILIYQLDAFVFRDELAYWCSLGYDYIGAPWLRVNKEGDLFLLGVGNGGFSLRKVQYCMRILEYPSWLPFQNPWFLLKSCSTLKAALALLPKILGFGNCLSAFRNKHRMINEDVVFGYFALNSWLICNIPDPTIAMKFSFESNPSFLFRLNDNKLPFGCHAFERHEYNSFWKEQL